MSSVIMRDPVVAADGLSYERRFIEKWLRDGNRSSPVTREPLRFPHLYPNQHLRTLIQRRPHGGASIAALHVNDPHFKQMDPNERRTAEVEWFVAKPNRGGYGVAKSDIDGNGSARNALGTSIWHQHRTHPALPYPPLSSDLTIVNRPPVASAALGSP